MGAWAYGRVGAWAHGDEPMKAAGPVRKEQKDWGIAGDARSVKRTIEASMNDAMRFSPATVSLRRGETVKFVIRNEGRQLHEFVLGTKKVLEDHAALMVKFPGMGHDEPCRAHVPAGQRGEIVWTFNRPGEFDFACLMAGHYQAGMVGRISVAAR